MKKQICFISMLFLFLISFGQQINFSKADSVARIYQGYSLKNLPQLSYNLTHKFSNKTEKFRAIYTWVSLNIGTYYPYNNKITKKHKKYKTDSLTFIKWNYNFNKKVFKRLLEKKETICTGYAYLIKELANLSDIECEIIHGYFKHSDNPFPDINLPNHSWNAVKLEGQWYLCDSTLSSGYYFHDFSKFIHDYNDCYFLTSPKLFIKSHYPIYNNWVLLKQKPSFEEFVNGPIIYKNAFEYGIVPVFPKTLAVEVTKLQSIQFQFRLHKTLNFSKKPLTMYFQSITKTIEPSFVIDNDTLIVNYNFKNKGVFDIHFKIENKPIATYSIRVNK